MVCNLKYLEKEIKTNNKKAGLHSELVCRFIPDGTLTYVNGALCRYLKKEKKELIGGNIAALILQVDKKKIDAYIESLRFMDTEKTIEHQLRLPDGEMRWQKWSFTVCAYDDKGKACEFESVGWDITGIKLINQELTEKETLLNAIADSAQTAILFVDDRTDEILYFNKQFCRMMGIERLEDKLLNRELKRSDFLIKCIFSIVDMASSDLSLLIQTFRNLQDVDNRTKIDHEIVLKTGEAIRILSGQIRDQSDNYIGRLYLFEDITTRKNNEYELKRHKENMEDLVEERTGRILNINQQLRDEIKEREAAFNELQKYKILFKNAKDVILFFDVTGKIIEANEAAVRCYGYSYYELIGLTIWDIHVDRQETLIEKQIAQAVIKGISFETVHRRKDGSDFFAEVSLQGTELSGEQVFISIIRDISERIRLEKQLEYFARYDYLTGIPNRFYFEESLRRSLLNNPDTKNALLYIDIDNFKLINDTFGHSIGDRVLVRIAERVTEKLRKDDLFARLGGDEFVVFLKGIDVEEAELISDRTLHSLEDEVFYLEEFDLNVKVTASIGIAMIEGIKDVDKSFSIADAALYHAKQKGKNKVVVLNSKEDKKKLSKNNRIMTLIYDNLENNRFHLHFQPIRDAEGEILHYEALVRMMDENGDLLYPAVFIPLAEKYNLMPEIDKLVLKNTLEILKQDKNLKVFMNLSGESLGRCELMEWIGSSIIASGIDPGQIGFEITETTAIRNLETAKEWIIKLKEAGCGFALDDFGVGFSSFSYLDTLSVDYLKIDGSFIRNLDSDTTKYTLVQAINTAAHTLGKKTIAEFVENEAVWRILHELKVDYGQGYYLGKPKPMEVQ